MSNNTTTVEVRCPVTLDDSGDHHGTSSRRCEGALEIELVWEPGESNWGADADGNRWMYVPGFWAVNDIPKKCDTCGFEFTPEGLTAIEKEAEALAIDVAGWEPDYPDCDDRDEDDYPDFDDL